jgi:hypothetical protein
LFNHDYSILKSKWSPNPFPPHALIVLFPNTVSVVMILPIVDGFRLACINMHHIGIVCDTWLQISIHQCVLCLFIARLYVPIWQHEYHVLRPTFWQTHSEFELRPLYHHTQYKSEAKPHQRDVGKVTRVIWKGILIQCNVRIDFKCYHGHLQMMGCQDLMSSNQ